jgi:hypothetical protein
MPQFSGPFKPLPALTTISASVSGISPLAFTVFFIFILLFGTCDLHLILPPVALPFACAPGWFVQYPGEGFPWDSCSALLFL